MKQVELKIQHFGPIDNGYLDNDGFMPISRITLLCGPQGSGKSCIAKVYSTLSWIEKALMRGDFSIKYATQYNRFVKVFCAFQNVQNYFSPDTYIHYRGKAFEMIYKYKHFGITPLIGLNYKRPQITYIPAERNLLSVVDNAENIKRLPAALASMLETYRMACRSVKTSLLLPINNASFRYDALNKIPWIQTARYSVRLNEASSGMQSLTPMYVTLSYLLSVMTSADGALEGKSLKEKENIQKRVNELLLDDTLDPRARRLLIEQIANHSNEFLLNIVEEPEENLYPSSQRMVLNSLLAFTNIGNNQLMLTTHSPYIINYLSLAIKAKSIEKCVVDEQRKTKLEAIVPDKSRMDGGDVVVYEINDDGCVRLLDTYDDMPSDNNLLNNYLAETNNLFNDLLELADE